MAEQVGRAGAMTARRAAMIADPAEGLQGMSLGEIFRLQPTLT
jgi:hypothetical protein